MPENYDHYITKNIKALYKRRLFSPIVYLIIVIVLWHVFSLTDLLFPVQLTDDVPLSLCHLYSVNRFLLSCHNNRSS